MPRRTLLLVVIALLLVGCVASTSQTGAPPSAPAAHSRVAFRLLPADAPGASRSPSLSSPPRWISGEWWTVKVTDSFDHETHEATRVVLGAVGDHYLVGMPAANFSDALMVLHMPGFGDVAMDTLGYAVHNSVFEPVKFPLTDGLRWQTTFEDRTLDAVASVKSPTLAEVDMTTGRGEHIHLTYDASLHDVSRIVFDGYATAELTAHGYGYAGTIEAPHVTRLMFAQTRTGPVLSAQQQPAAPLSSVDVDPAFERASFVLTAGSIVSDLQPGALDQDVGYYRETATSPQGTTYELHVMPTDSGLKAAYYSVDNPGGTWAFQQVVAGPGIAVAEGIGYQVYEVRLPSGEVLRQPLVLS